MDNRVVYLKPNVVIEPLVDSWYAWPHLISPATAAMNVVKRHMDIMESYLANPEAHAQAVLNAKMRGGPFMDFNGGRIEEVTALMQNTLTERAAMFELTKAIRALDTLLLNEAKGYSMEELYKKVPEPLQ